MVITALSHRMQVYFSLPENTPTFKASFPRQLLNLTNSKVNVFLPIQYPLSSDLLQHGLRIVLLYRDHRVPGTPGCHPGIRERGLVCTPVLTLAGCWEMGPRRPLSACPFPLSTPTAAPLRSPAAESPSCQPSGVFGSPPLLHSYSDPETTQTLPQATLRAH